MQVTLTCGLAVVEISEANHLACIFIPKLKIDTGQALPKGEPIYSLETVVTLPVYRFKIVLHLEQPDSG